MPSPPRYAPTSLRTMAPPRVMLWEEKFALRASRICVLEKWKLRSLSRFS